MSQNVNWPLVTAITLAIGKTLQYGLGLLLVAWPKAPKIFSTLKTILDDVLPNPSLPLTRASLAQPQGSAPTQPPGTGPAPLALKALVIGSFLVAGGARAQTFSAGLSVPLLEFTEKSAQPVQFAPGAGLEASLGFFEMTLVGESADLLDLSASLFATAPGALQAALTVGTFNNLICAGAAVPLSVAGGGGAFQGSLNVYPIIGGSIPFELGSAPPALAAGTQGSKSRRFGTIYFNLF